MAKPSRNHHFIPQSLISNWAFEVKNKNQIEKKVIKLNVAPNAKEDLVPQLTATSCVYDEFDKNSIYKDGREDEWETIITQVYDTPFALMLDHIKSELSSNDHCYLDPNSERTRGLEFIISFFALRNPKFSDYYRINRENSEALMHSMTGNEYKRRRFIKKNKDFLEGDYQKIWKDCGHYYWKSGSSIEANALVKIIADSALLTTGRHPKKIHSVTEITDALEEIYSNNLLYAMSNSINIAFANEQSKMQNFFGKLFHPRSTINFINIPDRCMDLYLSDMPLMEIGTGNHLLMRGTLPANIAAQLSFLPISPRQCIAITTNEDLLSDEKLLENLIAWFNGTQIAACARHLIAPPDPNFDRKTYKIDPAVQATYDLRRERGETLNDRLKNFYPNFELADKRGNLFRPS